jgi:putative oxidoreductase
MQPSHSTCSSCQQCQGHSCGSNKSSSSIFSLYTIAGQCSLLLLLRLYWGASFLAAGYQKAMTIESTTAFFNQLGIPLASIMTYIVILVEILGGMALIIGFKARIAALLLAITMLGAYYTAHYSALMAIFYKPSLFVEASPFNHLLICLIIYSFGPGRLSVDYFKKNYRSVR